MLSTTQNNEVQLARIEEQLDSLNDKLRTHTEQDMVQFSSMLAQLAALDAKMDAMLLDKARREGEGVAIKRFSGYISVVVSVVVTLLGWLLTHVSF